jgi:hypothetical protein
MNANLSELIAALPADDIEDRNQAEFAEGQLRQIFADLATRPAPVHSLHRLWTTGELSVQIALAYLALWIRSLVGSTGFDTADTKKRRTMETNLRLALKTFHRLGYLRGAMIKVGQAAAALPNLLPAGIAETLDKLHFEAPPMHYALMREMLANELGGDPDEVFARFDREAFAAASLGQVHRAILKSGDEVAVKVQYPAIARTIDADFRNLSALLFPARLTRDWDSVQESFAEIRRMLSQEIDYVEEAENLRRAAALFTPDDGIVVPKVYGEFSTTRVLTMEYLAGMHLDEFLATDPPQQVRNAFGTKMYTAWWRLYYGDLNHGDPHSGNYLFFSDGRLGLLDFGCVQRYGDEERELRAITEKLTESWEGFPEFLRRGAAANEQDLANPEYVSLLKEGFVWMAEALREGPFDFGDGTHLQRGIDWFTRVVRKRYTKGHPTYIYFFRSVFGLKSVLYRLRAQVDVKAVMETEKAKLRRGR